MCPGVNNKLFSMLGHNVKCWVNHDVYCVKRNDVLTLFVYGTGIRGDVSLSADWQRENMILIEWTEKRQIFWH